MRAIMFYSIAMILCLHSVAQTEKGKWQLGNSTSIISGNLISYNTNSSFSIGNFSNINNLDSEEEESIFQFVLNPSVGYFLIDNLSFGLKNTVAMSWVNIDDSSIRQNIFATGPQFQYFIGNGAVKTYFTASAVFGSRRTLVEETFFNLDLKENFSTYFFGLGAAYFINKNCSLNLEGGYSFLSATNTDTDESERYRMFGIDIGVNIFL